MAKVMSIQRPAEKADSMAEKTAGTEKGQGGVRNASVLTNGKQIALLLTIVVAVICLSIMMIRTFAADRNEDVSKMPPKMGAPGPASKP